MRQYSMAERDRYAPREWLPHERPTLPGSASTPLHAPLRRVQYGVIGVIVALTGGLSNALVTANLPYLQGALGAYAWEMAWLPAAFVMTNASANLLLVKFRQQFGLRLFTEIFLGLYVLATAAHLFVNDLHSAIAVRAAHGLVGAALSSLGIYYMIQAFPAVHRLKALVIGLGLSQLALPLARVFSNRLLEFGEWRGLYLFELGLGVVSLACVLMLKLPPSDRIRVFEKLDFLTFMLFASGAAGLAAVLSLGRYLWWTDTPWLGVTLACSIALLAAATLVEHRRQRPMINTRWLANGDMLRLAASIVLIRIALSEQGVGAVGFLQQLGMSNEQTHTLFLVVLLGTVLGIVASAVLLTRENLPYHLVASLAMVAVGAFMDAGATSLTRPEEMYFSQFLIGFGSILFLAPALLMGFGKVVTEPRNLISFIVLFGMSQNMGGLFGSAFLGTLQIWREKFHSSQLVEHLVLTDPQVAARVQAYAAAYAHSVADPAQRQALALKQLAAVATREANVLAYNDVFLVIGWLALATLAWMLFHLLRIRWKRRLPDAPAASTATANAAASTA
ncbi:MAG: MFS transporter [Pseudoxanthomonas sp.]